MSNSFHISNEDIIQHLKLCCQIPTVLEGIARQQVIVQTAEEVGITVTPEELQKEGDDFRLANHLVKAKDTWAWLEKHHLSVDEFESLIYNQILTQKLANHLFEQQVESFFYQNQLNYIAAATYEVILDDKDIALELFYAIQEGEITFSEIARQYIQNPEIRRAGGYQGVRPRSMFRPEVAAAVFVTTPPQIIKPITTSKGIYLIWVEEIIQPELNQQLRQEIITGLFETWLQQHIQKLLTFAYLDINNHKLKSELQEA